MTSAGDERRDLLWNVDAQGPCAADEGGRDQRQRDRDGDHDERTPREADGWVAAGLVARAVVCEPRSDRGLPDALGR
jgi:hypothetical protein